MSSSISLLARRLQSRCQALLRSSTSSYHSRQPSLAQEGDPVHVIDLRSDVLTKPTERMMQAMMKASLGDDVFNEDSCVHELQDKVAEMFGKERALFVASGTMGNLISVLQHCSHDRGLEVLLGDKSHIHMYEQGGIAGFGGIHSRPLPNFPDGSFDLDLMESYIRPHDDPHQPWTALVTVENTHNYMGGKVLSLDFIRDLRARADKHGLRVHMDGARLMNAAVALNVTPREILCHVDTVSMCLSKGVGTPIGSIIAGPHAFIDGAVRLRKALGGGWRQPGMLAAAALEALEDVVPRMERDHMHAKLLAKAIRESGQGVIDVDVDGVHTNIILAHITKPGLTAAQFCQRLAQVSEEEKLSCGETAAIRAGVFYGNTARLCTYHNLTDTEINTAASKLKYVLKELAETEAYNHTDTQQQGAKLSQGKEHQPEKEYETLLYDLAYRK